MSYTCFKCGKSVEISAPQQVGFRESCACTADLHACKNCVFYDLKSYNECRETSAERVVDKEKYNRCEYFRFREGGPGSAKENVDDKKKKLDDLFK